MALPSPLFVAFQGFETYIVDHTTGAPLSGGYVKFFEDENRTVEKAVYQQVQLPDNTYDFVNIGSTVDLTSVGTFSSPTDGTDIQVYAFPYQRTPENPGDIELYYFEVYSSGDVLQFTREAQPANVVSNTNPTDTFEASENLIANPQFVEVSFIPDVGASTFTYAASGTTTINIAPNWSITTVGSGNIVLQQLAISDANAPTNPPYVLDVNTTGSISSVILTQRFQGDPRLLINNYVSTSITVASLSGSEVLFNVQYVPSAGTYQQTLLSKPSTNNGQLTSLPQTAFVGGTGESSATAPNGYVDIQISWPPLTHIQITSVQIAIVQNESSSVEYIKQSTNRQVDHLFHYYKPELFYKPIPSYLVGWDFPLNPAQFGTSGNVTTTAAYIVDQTIAKCTGANVAWAFNSATKGLQFTTADTNNSFCLIQYLQGNQVAEFLTQSLSVNINAFATAASAGTATLRAYLFVGNGSSAIPALSSIIGTLNADGTFNLTAANWALIPFALNQTANGTTFQITTNADLQNALCDLGFSSWQTNQIAYSSVLNFAIVVTAAYTVSGTVVVVDSISLVPGEIPTRPAPKTADETLRECQRYYETSIPVGNVVDPLGVAQPGFTYTPTSSNSLASSMNFTWSGSFGASTGTANVFPAAVSSTWLTRKVNTPNATFFSTNVNTANDLRIVLAYDATSTASDKSINTFYLSPVTTVFDYKILPTATSSGTGAMITQLTSTSNYPAAYALYQYIADSRLGIV